MDNMNSLEDANDILNHAEEIKIFTSCINRSPSLRNLPYTVNRRIKDGIIMLYIEFSSRVETGDIEVFQKMISRDLFEHCVGYEYSLSIVSGAKKDNFDTSCESLLQHMREQF